VLELAAMTPADTTTPGLDAWSHVVTTMGRDEGTGSIPVIKELGSNPTLSTMPHWTKSMSVGSQPTELGALPG
jgi:hypothetical protein